MNETKYRIKKAYVYSKNSKPQLIERIIDYELYFKKIADNTMSIDDILKVANIMSGVQ